MTVNHKWTSGEKLTFHTGEDPNPKPARHGIYVNLVTESPKDVRMNIVEVKLTGDPFTVCVYQKQIRPVSPNETGSEGKIMAQAAGGTRLNAKELRRQAKELGVEGWEDLSLSDLRAAVASASAGTKSSTKKTKAAAAPVEDDEDLDEDEADDDEEDEDEEEDEEEAEDEQPTPAAKRPAKKAPAKAAKAAPAKSSAKKAAPAKATAAAEDPEPNENGNPYKPGTNLYEIAEELIKGGKRSAMVKRLKRKITLSPRNVSDDYDEDAELDRRVLIIGQLLRRDHGFNVVRDGRGADATIVAERP